MRRYSESPPGGVQQPPPVKPPWLCSPWSQAMMGFRPLKVFNAFSGNHMTRYNFLDEPYPVHIMVDITHTVADVEYILQGMFSNPRLTVAMPIPAEDPSLPIRAVMTKEMQQGLYICLPSLPEEESPPQDQQWLPPGFAWSRGPLDP